MLKSELFEVIMNFENALREDKLPDFNGNKHRAEQVLRILKCDFHEFEENESHRACTIRKQWEEFWNDYPEVDKYDLEYQRQEKRRRELEEEEE